MTKAINLIVNCFILFMIFLPNSNVQTLKKCKLFALFFHLKYFYGSLIVSSFV